MFYSFPPRFAAQIDDKTRSLTAAIVSNMDFLPGTLRALKDTVWPDKRTFLDSHYPDLHGKVWVVTGANSGIGHLVSKSLAKSGARVWLVGRSRSKLEDSAATIRKDVPQADLKIAIVDFSDLASFRDGISPLLKSEKSLNGIVHNAGVMSPPQGSVTAQNIDEQVGVNNLGPQLLQSLLDDLLVGSATPSNPGRIVWVSSAAHLMSSLNVNDFNKLNGNPRSRYAFSKALNIVQAYQWTRAHPAANVKSVSVHPGVIQTPLYRHGSKLENYFASFAMWPPENGAETELYGALYPDLPNNAYVVPPGATSKPKQSVVDFSTDERGQKFWDWANEQIAPYT